MQKKIIGFTIEIDGKEQINQTTTILGLLNTQLILLDTTLKEVNKQSNETFKDLSKSLNNTSSSASKLGDVVKGSISSFDKNSKAVRDLGNGYFEAKEQIQQIAKIDKKRIKQLNQLTSLTKEQEKELNSLLVAQQKQRNAAKERNAIAKQQAILETERIGTRKALKAQLALTTIELNKLTEAEQKGTKEGRRLTAQQLKLNETLFDLEKRGGTFSRRVGEYARGLTRVDKAAAKATKGLKKFALRLTVGRSVLEGLSNGVRNASQGLQQLVQDGDGTNEIFNELESSGDKLQATLVNVGTEFLGAFGSGIAKIIDNVSFVISVVSDSLIEASESTGFFGSVLRGVGEILTNFPAIFGGIVEASREFIANTGRAFTSFSINAQLAYENFLVFSKGIAGFDTSEAEKNIKQLTKELEKNSEGARTLGQAYTDGYNATLKAQEEFNKESEKEVEVQNKRAAAIKRREAARKEAAKAEKKRIEDERRAVEQLNKDRRELLNTLRQEAAARVEIAKDLQAQLVDIRIEAIKDETQRLEEAEKVRFEREKAAREASFKALQDQAASQEAEALRLFGESSKELKALEEQNDKDLLELSKINDKIGEAQEQAYQDNLLAIRKSAANEARTTQAEIDEQALQDVLEFQRKEEDIRKKAKDKKRKEEEEEEGRQKELVDALVSVFNTGFDLIEKLSSIGAKAEQERFNQAIEARKKNIEALNEDLQGATGLQKQFLKQQVKQEKEALEQEEKNREAAERKRVKQAQALALVQVAINGAIAVSRAFSDLGPIAGVVAAVGVGAAIIAQIAEISSQKFEKGGELKGKSHAQGGIPFTINGQAGFEAEGGEGLINKKSMGNPYLRAIASFANEAGGGVAFSNTKSLNKFQNGGLIGPSSPAPSVPSSADAFLRAIDTKTDAINSRIDRVQVALDVNNLQDFEGNEAKLQALTTLD